MSGKTANQANSPVHTVSCFSPAEIAPPFRQYKAASNKIFFRAAFLIDFGIDLFSFGFHFSRSSNLVLMQFLTEYKNGLELTRTITIVEHIYSIAKT